jgi:hypothetical protein
MVKPPIAESITAGMRSAELDQKAGVTYATLKTQGSQAKLERCFTYCRLKDLTTMLNSLSLFRGNK